MAHTKWKYFYNEEGGYTICFDVPESSPIVALVEDEEIAKRIVECVNGWDTLKAENKKLRQVLVGLKSDIDEVLDSVIFD